MTTYLYSLTLDETEVLMLKRALREMVFMCERRLEERPEAPWYAYLGAAKDIQTTYLYSLTLNETQAIMLESALEDMVSMCEMRLFGGAKAPWVSYLGAAKAVQSRLNDSSELTSSNSFS